MPLNNIRRWLVSLSVAALLSLSPPFAGHHFAGAAVYTSPRIIEEAFQVGLRVLAAGDASRAAQIFRSILAEHPGLPRVRLELARAYFEAEEWERARREFFAVLSGDIPENVKTRIIQFLRAIDARRGFDWNLSIGFSAAPEALRDYDTDVVLVDFLGVPIPFKIKRDKSGAYGVAVSSTAEYRLEIPGLSTDMVRVTGIGQAFIDVFEGNGSSADDYLIGGGVGVRGVWPQTTITGTVLASMREFGGAHFEDRFELKGDVAWRDSSGLALFSSGSIGIVDDHISELRDGEFARLRVGLSHSLGGRASVGMAVSAERLDASARFESFIAAGAEVFGNADVGLGIDTAGRLFLRNQRFDARVPLFFEARNEWECGFDLDFSKADFFLFDHFTPFVSVGFSRRDSSIAAFSFNEYRFNIGFRKTF